MASPSFPLHRALAVSVLALTLSIRASAESPHRTTLAEALNKSLAANPGLQAARHGAAATEGAVLQSQARPNPELAFTQEDTRSQTRSSTVQINQLIELGGKREARMRLAEVERATAHTALAEAEVALRFQVANHFNDLLLAQQRVEWARQTQELAARALDAAHKRVQAGKVPPLEASRAQVAEANAGLEVQQAQSQVLVAQQNLASLWGGKAAEIGEAKGDFSVPVEPPSLERIEERLNQSPAMVLAQHALEQSRAASELERAKRTQDPTLSLGVKRASEVGRNQVVLGVSIPLPLFDSNAGNQLQALRKVDQAEQKLQEQRLQLQASVLAARQQWLGSNRQVALLQAQVLPTAQSAYDVAVRGFTLGKFNFLDVLDAQRTLFDAQRLLLEQLMNSHRASAEIDRLLGTSSSFITPSGT
ncbi:TolC family protein [Diaphorobacter caeni]|uniref:TolC family protein n=1 Tax=Diaphorobacter caeni TaxID=2784387 RepID=UPI00188F68A8|nr:TolC family protein [Diaphorobacter caeni]MBF5005879.1 TolC family protein [Diaphorobacter caeni]